MITLEHHFTASILIISAAWTIFLTTASRHERDTPDRRDPRARFRSTAIEAVDKTYPDLTSRAYIERLICEHALFN